MNETQVSIGQVKRDISELVNRVAYSREKIILTSRGKPKAVLISLSDYEQLKEISNLGKAARMDAWLIESDQLTSMILADRGGEPIDMDKLWEGIKADREARDEQILGG